MIRFVKKFLVVLLLILILSSLGIWGFVKSRIPSTQGQVKFPFVEKPVRVVRDVWGIPHIFAESEKDAYAVLGFVAAQDRLFQMDIHRRLASGRLSEIVGEKALAYDKLFRTLRLKKSQEEFLSQQKSLLDPGLIVVVEAYLQGLNYFIQTQTLPLEFTVLGYKPEPFDFADIQALPGYMAYSFGEFLKGDFLFYDLLQSLPKEKVDELRTGYGTSAPTISQWMQNPNIKNLGENLLGAADQVMKDFGFFAGSNSWVLSPKRSKSGSAILANDPHIGFSKPSIWYEAHIQTPTLDLYGHYLSYVPIAVLGHTRDIAWALTMSEIDDGDCYLEKFNPQNPGEVMFRGKWVPVQKYEEVIKIKNRSPENLVVRVTPHGPVVGSLILDGKYPDVSTKWQFYEPKNNMAEAFYHLARSKTVEQFKKAIGEATAPGLNISYADKNGNIAWYTLGNIPIRPKGMASDVLLDGASGKDEYLGYATLDEHPHLVNPESGVIITANNKPIPMNWKFEIDGYWQGSDRAERITELLSTQEKWSLPELMKVQTDQKAPNGPKLVKALLESLDTKNLTSTESKALSVLRAWDGKSDIKSAGPTLYHKWINSILRDVVYKDLGPTRWAMFLPIADSWHFLKGLILNPNSPWWDNARSEIVTRNFRRIVSDLEKEWGSQVDNWSWGRIHRVEYIHPLGRQKPLNHIFNAGPFESGGSGNEIDAMKYVALEGKFDVVAGPSTRRLIDFSDVAHSFGINPLGNSGHLLSKHEKDQAQMFLQGEYRPQWMNLDDINKNAESEQLFEP